jgi:predicted aspartyl protease
MGRHFLVLGCILAGTAWGEEFGTTIPMTGKGLATFYVSAEVAELAAADFLVDTGSGYLTLNEQTLARLLHNGSARYLRNLTGILADGNRLVVPVYSIRELRIGGKCTLRDVEAAVFPGRTRQILGLSALNRAAPFIFSVEPPQLVLSHCTGLAEAGAAVPADTATSPPGR